MRRAPKKVASQLRIIGGMWRGRKLRFPDRPGLRPTGDRVRETLFNWLEPELAGAHCLDLFAGSGALGIEALSRGAARCDFVDADREALTAVEQHLNTLDASDRSTLQCGSAAEYLSAAQGGWDIVFVDPPFEAQLGESTLQQIATAGVSVTTTGSITKPACPIPSPSRKCSMRSSGKKPLATSGINS